MFSNTPRPTVPIYADSLDFTAPADEVIKHRARRALEPFGRIELMSKFQDAMRRVITGDNVQGESVIIIDVTRAVKFGKPFAHGRIRQWCGYVIRLGMDYEPAHLEIALSGSEHRTRGPKI